MSSFANKEMEPELENMSIFRRLRHVDYRVWFFIFAFGSVLFEVSKMEYYEYHSFGRNIRRITVDMLLYLMPVYAAVLNHSVALRTVKVYSTIFIVILAIIAALLPVWMIVEFNNGAPEQLRKVMKYQYPRGMNFWQRLETCVIIESYLMFIIAYLALQKFLVKKVLLLIGKEKKPSPVKMVQKVLLLIGIKKKATSVKMDAISII